MIISLFFIILIKFRVLTTATFTFTVTAAITSDNQSVNQQGDIQFTILLENISGSIDNNAKILITFPDQFPLAGLNPSYISFGGGAGDDCYGCDINIITGSIIDRVATISKVFQGFSSTSLNLFYTINNATFPTTATQTNNFVVQIWETSNMYQPLISDSTSNVVINSANCGCTLTPTDLTTGARTSLTIFVTSTQPRLEDKTNLQIIFPMNWIKSINNPIATNTGVTCSPLLNTSTSINCISISNILTVTKLFYGNISSSFSFLMDGFINPPITTGSNTTQISIRDSNYNVNEVCACSYSTFIAGNIAQTDFKMTAGISSLATGYLNFNPRNYNVTDNITIVFPSDFSLANVVNSTLKLNSKNNVTFTASIISNTITIKPNGFLLNYNISIPKILSPPSQKKTGTINITTYAGGYILNDGSYCCYSVTSLGTLSSVNITPISTNINILTNYTVQMIISNNLTNSSSILIYFPVQFNLSSSNTLSCNYTCKILNSSNLLSINLSTVLNQSSTINIQINNVYNPNIVGITNNFTIITVYDSGGGYVDTYTGSPITFISTLTKNVTITTTSNQVYQNTSLKIVINNTLPLSSGTIIQINIPV